MGLLRAIGWNKFFDVKAAQKSLVALDSAIASYYLEKDETKKEKYFKKIETEKKNLKGYATKANAQYTRNSKKFAESMKKEDKEEIKRYSEKKTVLHSLIETIPSSVDAINLEERLEHNKTQIKNIESLIRAASPIFK